MSVDKVELIKLLFSLVVVCVAVGGLICGVIAILDYRQLRRINNKNGRLPS